MITFFSFAGKCPRQLIRLSEWLFPWGDISYCVDYNNSRSVINGADIIFAD